MDGRLSLQRQPRQLLGRPSLAAPPNDFNVRGYFSFKLTVCGVPAVTFTFAGSLET